MLIFAALFMFFAGVLAAMAFITWAEMIFDWRPFAVGSGACLIISIGMVVGT